MIEIDYDEYHQLFSLCDSWELAASFTDMEEGIIDTEWVCDDVTLKSAARKIDGKWEYKYFRN